MPDNPHEERFRQHEASMEGLARLLVAQHEFNRQPTGDQRGRHNDARPHRDPARPHDSPRRARAGGLEEA